MVHTVNWFLHTIVAIANKQKYMSRHSTGAENPHGKSAWECVYSDKMFVKEKKTTTNKTKNNNQVFKWRYSVILFSKSKPFVAKF